MAILCKAKQPTWFGEICNEEIEKVGRQWQHIRRYEKTFDHTANPYKIVQCPICHREIRTKAKNGRTQCVKCRKPFIFDEELFLETSRKYTHLPEVWGRRKEWEKANRERYAKKAMERYWKKHDHIRRLNNLASARLRGVSAISLEGSCELCGIENGRMHRHHILPQSANGENSVDNLIRVCNRCHKMLEAKITNEIAKKYPQIYLEVANNIILEVKRKNGRE